MQRPLVQASVGIAALAVALAFLAFSLRANEPETPARPPEAAPTDLPRPAAPLAAAPSPEAPAPASPLTTRRFHQGEVHAALPATSGPPVDEALHREFPTPDAAEKFVEDKVVGLLTVVKPDLDLTKLAHGCSDDGRHCTFEGPWLGDDFFQSWVRTIATGGTSLDALEGVRFTAFRADDRPDGSRVFVLEAHAP